MTYNMVKERRGRIYMKKYMYIILVILFVSLCYLIFTSANIVLSNDLSLPKGIKQADSQYRLVLITRDMDTTFWNKVGIGALRQRSEERRVGRECWAGWTTAG